MSIKDYFSNLGNKQFNKSKTVQTASILLESSDFIDAKRKQQERFIPHVDFTTASNFAKFGSAEMYYDAAFKRIYQEYPYDGTLAEKIEFENSSSYFDKYIFDNLYPRTNGYANFTVAAQDASSVTSGSNGYTDPTTKEYIKIFGGPHTASNGMIGKTLDSTFSASVIYDVSERRGSSLEITMLSGSTIEFWMKKRAEPLVTKEIIFDLWNGESTSDTTYGRLTLYTSATNDSLYLTLRSGSTGINDQLLLEDAFDGNWHHYALTLKSLQGGLSVNLYKDNVRALTSSYAQDVSNIIGLTTGTQATIGAMITTEAVSGDGGLGHAKLSASLDEFRFWKKEKTHEEIDNTWFIPIGGGTNKYDSNIDLLFYYKFNEGITTNSALDAKVLDYSGRIANGKWVGYSSAGRSTGSAMVESGVVLGEFEDPIIYSSHPDVSSSMARYKTSGSLLDRSSPSMFYRLFPSWMQETDTENGKQLKILSQIIGTYFDSLWHQIGAVNLLHDNTYISSSNQPYPFAKNVLYSKGFVLPDLFSSYSDTEKLLDKNTNKKYKKSIDDVRNTIYHNLNQNLLEIYKSKGTEKSFRNFFRSLGIGSELIRLNMYADDSTHILEDNYYNDSAEKNYVNFYVEGNVGATIHSQTSSLNSNTYIGSPSNYSSITMECNLILPNKNKFFSEDFISTNFLTSSVFGFHTAETNTIEFPQTATDYELNVFVVKEKADLVLDESENPRIKFLLSGSAIGVLSSSYIANQYIDNNWNIAVKIKHEKYPFSELVTGSNTSNYMVEFYGVESEGNTKRNSFSVTSSNPTLRWATYGTDLDKFSTHSMVNSDKRIYAGAHRQDFIGSVLQESDVKIGYLTFWNSYLSNEQIDEHSYDVSNYGINSAHDLDTILVSTTVKIPRSETLAMHWAFNTNTSSNGNGIFRVYDLSSGSSTSRYGTNIIEKMHEGKGRFFNASSTKCFDKNFIYVSKKRDINNLFSSDGVRIMTDRSELFFTDNDVSDVVYSFEKSLFGAISDEMIKLFSSAADFNNLIGQQNQKFHMKYHDMSLLKDVFFNKVENDPDLDRYTSFYKWIDDSISLALGQLIPAAAKFNSNISDVVENHVLERNKYLNQVNTLVERNLIKEIFASPMRGISELLYDWEVGHAPTGWSDNTATISSTENTSCLWQKDRKEKTQATAPRNSVLPSAVLATTRDAIRNIKNNHTLFSSGILQTKTNKSTYFGSTYALRKLAKPYNFETVQRTILHGGTNYRRYKNKLLMLEALQPHAKSGPGKYPAWIYGLVGFAPQNVITIGEGSGQGLEIPQDCDDAKPPSEKTFYNFVTRNGRFFGKEYLHTVKGDYLTPFTFVEDTVHTGYNKAVADFYATDVVVTNVHNDATYDTNDIPMQGVFTETHVGGHQSRHVDVNRFDKEKASLSKIEFIDSAKNRAEAWGFVMAEVGPGALASGFVSPDYGGLKYPNVHKLVAHRFRDEHVKRPISVRNILYDENSSVVGNYRKGYEISMLQRTDQKRWYRDAFGNDLDLPSVIKTALPSTTNHITLIAQEASASGTTFSPHVGFGSGSLRYGNAKNFAAPRTDLTSSTWEVVTRFSAPGGPEIQSIGYLDVQRQTFSVYNALPFRNLSVRSSASGEANTIRAYDHIGQRRGLRTLLSQHQGRAGIDSLYAVTVGPIPSIGTGDVEYHTSGSFQKQHRNISRRLLAEFVGDIVGTSTFTTGSRHDNGFISSALPRSEFGYSWILSAINKTNSTTEGTIPDFNTQPILGYAPRDGLIKNSSGTYVSAINFPTASAIYGS